MMVSVRVQEKAAGKYEDPRSTVIAFFRTRVSARETRGLGLTLSSTTSIVSAADTVSKLVSWPEHD